MNKYLSTLLALLLALPARSEEHPPAPQPPYLAPLPDNTTWTIKVTNSSTSAKMPPGVRAVDQLVGTKSGDVRVLVSEWTDGSRSEIWFSQGYRLVRSVAGPSILVTPLPRSGDLENSDFFDLKWLSSANYAGIESQGGHPCYHFKTQVGLEGQHVGVDYSAYIDVKTKRPVSWDIGANHFELVSIEGRNSGGPLLLPEAFAKQLNAYRLAAGVTNSYRKP
jgi:hypothetical protein